jgi:hypothetical protein
LLDSETREALRRKGWRQPSPLTRRARILMLALVMMLHALFALAVWYAMQSKPASVATVDSDQVLTVRLLDRSDTPRTVQPPAPPMPPELVPTRQARTPRVRPATHEKPRRDAMVVQDHEAASRDLGLYAKAGSVRLPPTTYTWVAAEAKPKPAKPADDRQIMQHERNRMQYKATRFEKYFPPPGETAGGAVGRHIGDALKQLAASVCDPSKSSTVANPLCAPPPLPPSAKEGDARLNLPPAPLADGPPSSPSPPLSTCIDEYRNTKPLSSGCPANTPDLAFKAEMRVCIDLFRAGKRLKTWCPLDTPKRAAAEASTPAVSSSTDLH